MDKLVACMILGFFTWMLVQVLYHTWNEMCEKDV